MRKLIQLLILVNFLNNYAQNFGFKLGLNIAQTTINTQSARYGFNTGVLAEFKVNKGLFSFQPEILYSQQGYGVVNSTNRTTYNFDYISVPILFKYFLTGSFSFNIGPQFSFNVNNYKETVYSNSNYNTTEKLEGVQFFDFGVNVGVGFKLFKGFSLDFRYNKGMSNIYIFSPHNLVVQHSVLQLGFGYMF